MHIAPSESATLRVNDLAPVVDVQSECQATCSRHGAAIDLLPVNDLAPVDVHRESHDAPSVMAYPGAPRLTCAANPYPATRSMTLRTRYPANPALPTYPLRD